MNKYAAGMPFRTRLIPCVIAFLAAVSHVSDGLASVPDSCIAGRTTIAYFNDGSNTLRQASSGLQSIRSANVGGNYESSLNYELFYTPAGASGLFDLADTFVQKANEIDGSGELVARWRIFWEAMTGDPSDILLNPSKISPELQKAWGSLYSTLMARMVAFLVQASKSPPTAVDSPRHRDRLQSLADQKQQILLIGHAQGNLSLNTAFDLLFSRAPASSLAAIHIAPTSPSLRGEYVLADTDSVINELRQIMPSVLPANVTLPLSSFDPSGHTLTGAYLDSNKTGRGRVKSLMNSSLKALVAPSGVPSSCVNEYRQHFMRLAAGTFAGTGGALSSKNSEACVINVSGMHGSTLGVDFDFGDVENEFIVSAYPGKASISSSDNKSGALGDVSLPLLSQPASLLIRASDTSSYLCRQDESTSEQGGAQSMNLGSEIGALMENFQGNFLKGGCGSGNGSAPVTFNTKPLATKVSGSVVSVGDQKWDLKDLDVTFLNLPSRVRVGANGGYGNMVLSGIYKDKSSIALDYYSNGGGLVSLSAIDSSGNGITCVLPAGK